ncbi:hypothetical protein OPV09_17530 [Janthinobacterium sp. TB1-E2]|uniref:GntR family transcriptional regulator n=1 Tax=Janthinobacterium aestuarii TaxID=2985511 RepID=A0ABZ2GGS4_9BURK
MTAFEVALSETTHPPHYLARDYLESRAPAPDRLPTREEVRRELGWTLIAVEHQTQAEDDERN